MSSRLERLQVRRVDPSIKGKTWDQAVAMEAFARVADDDAIKYAIGAMQPIDPDYTKNCFVEGDRVKNQLDKGLSTSAEFAYQGSVTNDTHIKAHSDIDLLTLHSAFSTVERPGVPAGPYQGDVFADLKSLRLDATTVLRKVFPEANVDDAPGKAISLTGGSLRRKVDVVIGNWWDTVEYQQLALPDNRGVKIFDSRTGSRIENKPFLHNNRVATRDQNLNGSLRKVIRLLKSLRYDAETEVKISSYDIAAIGYAMPDHLLSVPHGFELRLVEACQTWLLQLASDNALRERLEVPNGMRRIFGADGASTTGLHQLYREVAGLMDDIKRGLSRSFRKLEEARVVY
ncbi:hypothetical protein [Dyella sp.]|uniref:hypothetical protein n=1 Tax=Dyella sp. TaxID=1869338 RepID=UPI002D774CAE|nr:hypothetical protein [Dyella sp.]HET6432890.1 hypothetical protein [Dyella sp.]